MKPTKGTELLKYLRKVNFKGLSGDMFQFDPNGDGPARYNIIHFKQTSPGKFQWIKVGEYMGDSLHLNMSGKTRAGWNVQEDVCNWFGDKFRMMFLFQSPSLKLKNNCYIHTCSFLM